MLNNGFENGNGQSFVIGLLAGAVVGAGLGMLFAPKSGSDLRNTITDQAGSLATAAMNTATEAYKRASGAVKAELARS
jgi:gas vesicle protein